MSKLLFLHSGLVTPIEADIKGALTFLDSIGTKKTMRQATIIHQQFSMQLANSVNFYICFSNYRIIKRIGI